MPTTILGKVAMIPRGVWAAGTYNKNEYVYYELDNAQYVCIKDGTTIAPTDDGVNWFKSVRGIGTISDNNYTDADKAKVGSAIQPEEFNPVKTDLSERGINVKNYGASGSSTTTTGTISAGSTALTLASAIDFADGQGISINHAGAACTLTVPAAPTVTPTGTAGTTTYQYQIVALDGNGGCTAAGTAGTTATGNATLDATNYNVVSWAAVTNAVKYAVYGRISGTVTLLAVTTGLSFNDTGAAEISSDILPSSAPTAALADTFITTIVSGAGTASIVLSVPATTGATAQTVGHDDTVAIQNAVNDSHANGLTLVSSPGEIYAISSPLTIANPSFIDFGGATIKALNDMDSLINFTGHDYGGKIKNITLDCNNFSATAITISDAMHMSICGIKGINIKTLAVKVIVGYEILFSDSEFNANGNINATGFDINTSDSVYANITLINFKTGFSHTYSSNYFNNIHAWIANPSALDGSTVFNVTGNYCTFLNCYGDTYEYCFNMTDGWIISISNFNFFVASSFYNNTTMPGKPPTIIHSADTKFTNNIMIDGIYGWGAPNGEDVFCDTDYKGRLSRAMLLGFTDIIDKKFSKTEDLTLSSGVTKLIGYMQKVGSICKLNFILELTNATSNTNIVIGNLPVGYRPHIDTVAIAGISAQGYKIDNSIYLYISASTGDITATIVTATSSTMYLTIDTNYIWENDGYYG